MRNSLWRYAILLGLLAPGLHGETEQRLDWQFAEPFMRAGVEAEANRSVADAVWRQEVNKAYASLRRRLKDEQMLDRLTQYLFYAGRYQEAAETAWAGLQMNPDHQGFLFKLSAALIFENDYVQAQRLISAIEAESEGDDALHFLRAWSLHRQGKYAASNKELDLIGAGEASRLLIDLNRALNFQHLGQAEEAAVLLARHADEVKALTTLHIAKKAQDPAGQWIEMNLEEVAVPGFLQRAEDELYERQRTKPAPEPLEIQILDEELPEDGS